MFSGTWPNSIRRSTNWKLRGNILKSHLKTIRRFCYTQNPLRSQKISLNFPAMATFKAAQIANSHLDIGNTKFGSTFQLQRIPIENLQMKFPFQRSKITWMKDNLKKSVFRNIIRSTQKILQMFCCSFPVIFQWQFNAFLQKSVRKPSVAWHLLYLKNSSFESLFG